MRIFLAGATGVIGVRLLPLMLAEGHVVAAMTRTPEKVNGLRAAGVTPVLCDLFDQKSLTAAVKDFRPDVIVHQVTDLPDEIGKLAEFLASTDRVRSEGTRNLLAAAQAVNASGFVAQSIAWGEWTRYRSSRECGDLSRRHRVALWAVLRARHLL